MNKRVFIAMLILCVSFLFAIYILKCFFPNEFMFNIQNENVIKLGTFIDEHIVLYFIAGLLLGFVTDYLYFGAVLRMVKLDVKRIVIIISYNIVFNTFYTFLPADIIGQYSSIFVMCSTCYMFLTPLLFTKELLPLAITYTVTYISQTLSLSIRNLAVLLQTSNFITSFLATAEGVVWTVLCFIIFNYRKENDYGLVETSLRKSKVLLQQEEESTKEN